MNHSLRTLWGACLLSLTLLLLVFLAARMVGAREAGFESADAADAVPADVLAHIRDQSTAWGLTAEDIAGLRTVDVVPSSHNGVTHYYLRQTFNGLDVIGTSLSISLASDGQMIHTGNRLVPDLASRINTTGNRLTAVEAVQSAAHALKLPGATQLTVQETFDGPAAETILLSEQLSREPIPARLVYQLLQDGAVHLAWDMDIFERSGDHYWSLRVDANDGALLEQVDYVIHDYWGPAEHAAGKAPRDTSSVLPSAAHQALTTEQSAVAQPQATEDTGSYMVFAIPKAHPDDGPRTLVVEPADTTASPFGWHDTNGADGAESNYTIGNNVHAYTDIDANDLPDLLSEAYGGASLVFSDTLDLNAHPWNSGAAAVTNLFYWSNITHDVFYRYGFDEVSGNFQVNNYGNGGLGNDRVLAEAQDGLNTNNANFLTPPDGTSGRMQMFLWDQTTPMRDGAYSSNIIVHEYGHGISVRLAGGPSTASCLTNDEQMGEGWSDFFALVLTTNSGHTATTPRGVGTYALGQPVDGPGIRPTVYTTDMTENPTTYGDIDGLAVPHGVGYAWASMLWDVYWALIEEHGFNPDIYDAWSTGGNNLALQLVIDGLKLQVCRPGFVDGRDAILDADVALTGGANQCLLWEAFARRGLGASASQGSPFSSEDGVEAFDLPAQCMSVLTVEPASQSVCAGTAAVFDANVGSGFTAPVTLGVSGHPVGSTASISPNPVTSTPDTATITIDNTGGAAVGDYELTVTADDGTLQDQATATLNVVDAEPGAALLVAPADSATGVSIYPSFSWTAASNAQTYLLEIADDEAFTSIQHSVVVSATTYDMTTPLTLGSTYYWRVTPQNGCGDATPTAPYQFTVQESSLACGGGAVTFEEGIPGDWTVESGAPGGIDWTITSNAACNLGNLTGGSGEAACANSDEAGSGSPPYDARLISPAFDLPAGDTPELQLAMYYNDLGAGNDLFRIELWDGAAWQLLQQWDEDVPASQPTLDLTPYAGMQDLQIRFRYSGNGWDWYAQVDDVSLDCAEPEPDPDPDPDPDPEPDVYDIYLPFFN